MSARINCIVPPHLLRTLLDSDDADVREAAMNTMLSTAWLCGQRAAQSAFVGSVAALAAPAGGRRTVFDLRHKVVLSTAVRARSEDDPAVADPSVNRAFDGFGATRKFYLDEMARDSIDGHGMRLDGYVHRGVAFNNAFWDGQRMVFGDGDGRIFTDFTAAVDVIAHELTHGVTEHTAGLEYHNQSGALNESISDVFGSLVKQWSANQSAENADWLIGAEVFTPDVGGDALRSMKDPGHAYDNPLLGKDPQPGHMSDYVHLPDTQQGDNGGVHINSGITNKAFYLAAIEIGGFAWKAPGHIWYAALLASNPNTDFQSFADSTDVKAGQLYGVGSAEQRAVRAAWMQVGIRTEALVAATPRDGGVDESRIATLEKRIEELATDVAALRGSTDGVPISLAQ